ncbi:MAG: hypothetical protein IJL87_04610 [Clostridia bacterium]|nr:hypothetical protein [Clostridia bacterium]
MVSKKDLLCLHTVFIMVRLTPQNEDNVRVLKLAEEYLLFGKSVSSLSELIDSLPCIDCEKWKFEALCEHYTDYPEVSFDSDVIFPLANSIAFLRKSLEQGDYQTAEKTADDLHNIPTDLIKADEKKQKKIFIKLAKYNIIQLKRQ